MDAAFDPGQTVFELGIEEESDCSDLENDDTERSSSVSEKMENARVPSKAALN